MPGATTAISNSTGLGLAIARDSIQVHGGSIVLRTVEQGGLLVRIELPAGEWQR